MICPKQEPFSGRCRQLGRAVRYKKFMQRLGRLLPWRGQQKTRAAVTR
ncbi:MAG: hypothetical protein ACYSOI_06790 [Planctomycetota bacterium]